MTPEQAKGAWERARANGRALDACPGPHTFADTTPERTFGKRYRCSTCNGEVDGPEKLFYEQGLKHGRAEVGPDSVGRRALGHLPGCLPPATSDKAKLGNLAEWGCVPGCPALERSLGPDVHAFPASEVRVTPSGAVYAGQSSLAPGESPDAHGGG